jgi:hypothetical protein
VYSPRIGINQVEPQAVELAQQIFGGGSSINHTQDRFGKKALRAWFLGSDGLIEALRELIPFLRIKKEQARVVLALQENIREWKGKVRGVRGQRSPIYPPDVYEFRESCYQKLRALRLSPVAETESDGSLAERKGDATVRTSR